MTTSHAAARAISGEARRSILTCFLSKYVDLFRAIKGDSLVTKTSFFKMLGLQDSNAVSETTYKDMVWNCVRDEINCIIEEHEDVIDEHTCNDSVRNFNAPTTRIALPMIACPADPSGGPEGHIVSATAPRRNP